MSVANDFLPVLGKLSSMTKAEVLSLGLTEDEYEIINVLANPVKWAAVNLDWHARDYQIPILEQGAIRTRTVLRLGRRLGKCLPGWVKILDPQTGQRIPIEELYRQGKANVATMNSNYKLEKSSASHVMDNGVKEVFRVSLKSGRHIDATGNHPLYRLDGWTNIYDLAVGDKVATPRVLDYFGNISMPEEQIKFLAYMIGDGNCTTTTLRFSNQNEAIMSDFTKCVESFGDCHVKQYSYNNEYCYNIVKKPEFNKRTYKSSIQQFLREQNVFGKSALQKEIPESIYALPKSQMSIFLSHLYSTDGWVTSSYKEKGRVEIGYCSSSESLARGVQHLLLRFGIQSKLVKRKVKYNGDFKETYVVGIYRKDDILKFEKEIGIFGKEEAMKKAIDIVDKMKGKEDPIPVEIMKEVEELRQEKRLTPKEMLLPNASIHDRYRRQYAPQRRVLHHYGEVLESERLQALASSDLYWDEIVSIESIGHHQTYDLSIPETKNFVANDIIVHNSECMVILILWHAFTQINRDLEKSNDDPYDILILTPAEPQAILIYDRIVELIGRSDELKDSISRNISLRIELKNNTCITLMTLGTANSTGGASVRGQKADLLIYDEADFIGSDELINTIAIANEDKRRIKILAASTPSGDRREYYNWCVNASHSFEADVKKIDKESKVEYNYINRPGRQGNGWTHIYAPSTVNKKLYEVNPDTGMTGIEELAEEFTESKYQQEVLAEFGESEAGVYQKKYIDEAVNKGRAMGLVYASNTEGTTMKDFPKVGPRILGVDWDMKGNPTNMVGMQFVEAQGIFVPFVRVEIQPSEFTYDIAVNKIIEMDSVYNFDWVYADAGHGEGQIQFLKKYGMSHPETNLQHKVVRVNFSEKVETRDAFTQKIIKQHIKPFMVGNLTRYFERGQIALQPEDRHTIRQFEGYHVVRWGQDGRPVYTDKNEHIHDCILLAMHGFVSQYTDMLKTTSFVALGGLSRLDMGASAHVNERSIYDGKPEEDANQPQGVVFGGLGSRRSSKRRSPIISRTMF